MRIFETLVPRRSNRRPDGDQQYKKHGDRALLLMLLGDFETASFASLERCLRSSNASPAQKPTCFTL
ncbi:hypothetical protein B9J76_04055 [Lacticaseibacillus paracasei]|nr:hypothetical protein CFM84_04960 [Lacticaseibacillus paracasei]MCT3316011.1 hypothetical protein [Lacticaseibacillus paracasei]MCT3361754.1 hypothetical protein [Lacticaseibacillus paracasei]OSP85203.1 hypothetical protein B9J76_04055 [Lacticaseibacillus paracasei]TJY22524.1 hypothetical protein FCF24_06880 [Lacticaseibacillus paracasei]